MRLVLKDNEELSIHEILSFVRGGMTQNKFHFYGFVSKAGAQDRKLKEYRGASYPKVEDGARIPMNKQSNNPSLSSPNVAAMKFFGQIPIFKSAVDQLFSKPIGVFPSPSQGAGMNAFGFMNSELFKSSDSIMNIAGKVLLGEHAKDIKDGHLLFETLKRLGKKAGKAMGGDENTTANPSSAGDLPKLMKGLATGFAGMIIRPLNEGEEETETQDPFSSSVYSDGVTMAQEVTDYIKKLA